MGQVLPTVRLMFACDDATFIPADSKWILTNPWTAVKLPKGAKFPFRVEYLWVYLQLSGGLGTSEIMLEMVQHKEDGTRTMRSRSPVHVLDFDDDHRLAGLDTAMRLRRVPFPSAGLYEFRIVSGSDSLSGVVAVLQVLNHL